MSSNLTPDNNILQVDFGHRGSELIYPGFSSVFMLQEKKWFLLEILLFLFIGAFTPLLEVQFPNKMYCSSNLRFEASLFISSSLSVIGNVLPTIWQHDSHPNLFGRPQPTSTWGLYRGQTLSKFQMRSTIRSVKGDHYQ